MYAIFEDGGKQYKVAEGDTVLLETRERAEGDNALTLDQVLMVGEGADAKIGQPWISGASVSATILEDFKTPKITGAKFKRRKGYRRMFGHRQQMLRVRIDKINA